MASACATMRVGLVIYGSIETLSGGYLYDRKLVAYLRSQGDEVEIFSLPWRDYPRHLTDNLRRAWLKRLQSARLDVLLQDELNHPSLFLLNRRLRASVHYPLVSIVHHLRCSEFRPDWLNGLYRRVERSYLTTVNGFIYNSRATQAAVEELAGTSASSVVTYPGGDRLQPALSAEEIGARAQLAGPLRLLFVGNLIPRKGLHTLLAALEQLPAQLWRLQIVGNPDVDPAYTSRIRQQIQRLGYSHQVELLGTLPDDALSNVLKANHVLVVPSSYEGFGIVYLEGMGFGLPAIATNAGGAGEIVRDGENGYVINPGDAGALATRINHLYTDRMLLKRMSLSARQCYESHPTWEATCRRIRTYLLEQVK